MPHLNLLSALLSTLLLTPIITADPIPAPIPSPEPGLLPLLDSIVRPVLDLGALPPPTFARTKNPSPECANVNQGELQCCRATIAGDQQVVVWLAKLYGYNLNPNDINGVNCDGNLAECPGVKVCCQVTMLSPLLSLYCQDNN